MLEISHDKLLLQSNEKWFCRHMLSFVAHSPANRHHFTEITSACLPVCFRDVWLINYAAKLPLAA